MFDYDDRSAVATSGIDVTVPGGIQTAGELMDHLARGLRFPDYFGGNWDAVDECLRDLSWLSAGSIVLRHDDVPLAGEAVQKTYLEILAGAVEEHAMSTARRLVVTFPSATRDRVMRLMSVTPGS